MLSIAEATPEDDAALVDLWTRCGLVRPWNDYLAVDPAQQGKGHGRAMTQAGEAWLKARGCEKVMLMVRPDNTKVADFYKAAGYFEQPRALFAKWLDGREPTP